MTASRWQRVGELFRLALEREPEARTAFLEDACAADDSLRREVGALLAEHARTGYFLDHLIAEGGLAEPDRTPPAPLTDPYRLVGKTVGGKYRVDAPLGRGGCGVVYRATHLALRRPVALKTLHDDRFARVKPTERFTREALAIARLKHPNIVAIYDLDVSPEFGAYIVMEFLDGASLAEALRERSQLPLDEVLEIASAVCSALESAHAHGVIHRDIKPANIFVEKGPERPRVKVLDFGIAKLQSGADDEDLTAEDALLGTPAYMSPEQCNYVPVDARSDVYSLGCVVYEMLTGRQPFTGEGSAALLVKHRSAEPSPPSRHRPGLPPAIDAAVLRAMAKRPEDRFQTAASFAAALADAWAGPDPSRTATADPTARDTHPGDAALPPGAVERSTPTGPGPAGPFRGWLPAGGLAAVIAVAVAAYAFWPTRQAYVASTPVPAPEARVEALRYFLELDGRPPVRATGADAVASGTEMRLHLVPRSDGFLYVVAPGRGGVPTTLLTARPSGAGGNALRAGTEFVFPSAEGSWIRLEDKGYPTRFTLVLSPVALDSPVFLRTAAGHSLTPAEQQQWDALVAQYRAEGLQVTAESGSGSGSTVVEVPADRPAAEPLAFDIVVRHR